MRIIVCAKVVPDVESVSVDRTGSLDLSRAHWGISDYDYQALEAGRQLAAAAGAACTVLTVGPAQIDKAALRKDLLSRGPEDLCYVADDSLAGADTRQTVEVLAAAVKKLGGDVVICGEGSADRYAQSTGVQLGETLGFATVNDIDSLAFEGGALKAERLLEDKVEVLSISIPASISVTSSINTPPIPKMKDILSGGKKPQTGIALGELLDSAPAAALEVEAIAAPAEPDRKKVVFSGSVDEAVSDLISQLKQEGLL